MVTLKEQKEQFVTGFEGTSPQELLLVCSTAPIGCFFYQSVTTTNSIKALLGNSPIVLEIVAFVIPMILCESNRLYPWGVSYLSLQLFVALAISLTGRNKISEKTLALPSWRVDCRRNALTVYRAAMLYLTFVAILAVDFTVFPRRFVKTETRGYSLMDLGAASFVVAAGFVSPRARGKRAFTKASRIFPLLFMGFLRLLTHRGIDYQEHSSEYGVHWNFFFTLAILAPTASLLPGPTLWTPCLILGIYQYFLSFQGLQEWVEEAPRSCETSANNSLCNMVVANREGLLGCVGYAVLYLLSEWIACRFFWGDQPSSSLSLGLVTLAVGAAWRLMIFCDFDVSRRTTNATFCTWTLFVNCAQLTAILMLYEHTHSHDVSPLLHATNRNGLTIFILANLLTGLVNLSVNTLAVQDRAALGILTFYISIIGAAAVFMDALRRRRKANAPKEHSQ